jgi:hypothetical protein
MTFTTKKFAGFLFFYVFTATSLLAQADQGKVTDAELNKFATVFQQMRMMNQQVQQKMAQSVAAEEMEVQRFNEIHKAQLDPEKEINTSSEEQEKYEDIVLEIEKAQLDFQKKMEEAIQKSGLSVERYQQIATRMQKDTQLQERLRNSFQK